jgi:HSP20 family protein
MSLVERKPANLERSCGADPFFDRFFDLFEETPGQHSSRAWRPAMDLLEHNDRLVVLVDLPGVDPKSVDVKLTGDRLTLSGERKPNKMEEATWLKREQVYGPFTRTIQLPYQINGKKVRATYENGVMSIELPKSEEYIGRQIPIEVK